MLKQPYVSTVLQIVNVVYTSEGIFIVQPKNKTCIHPPFTFGKNSGNQNLELSLLAFMLTSNKQAYNKQQESHISKVSLLGCRTACLPKRLENRNLEICRNLLIAFEPLGSMESVSF